MAATTLPADTNLPWVEKYRPEKLEQLISHNAIIETIQKFIAQDRLPHLLFYGPPGTGKTSTIKAVAKLLYGSNYRSMVLELNASDDRGINVVREQIKTFASTRTVFNTGFKLVILDEADAMTNDAQAALRRVIEKFTKNTRFCLICNYASKIIPALQSRCTRFRFAPLSQDQMKTQINRVIESEKLNATEDGIEAIIRLSQGDMRRALNILQSTSMSASVIDEECVHACTGAPFPADIHNILQMMLNLSIKESYQKISELKTQRGLALTDILTDVHRMVFGIDFPTKPRIYILEKLADIEEKLAYGADENIQLAAMIAAFYRVRVLAAKEAEQSA